MSITTLARGEVLGVNVRAFDCSGALLRKLAKGRTRSKLAAREELDRRSLKREVKTLLATDEVAIAGPALADPVIAADDFWAAVRSGHVVELDGMPVLVAGLRHIAA